MRKYLFLIILPFLAVSFFLFSGKAEAIGVGEQCAYDDQHPQPACLDVGCIPTQCDTGLTCGPDQKCVPGNASGSGTASDAAGLTGTPPPPPSPPCKQWTNGQCTTFSSAVGDLATDPGGFVKTIFAALLSFSGGIALLLIIRAGYRLMTSQGKPDQISQGRDQLVAAIVGLVFLIFSFVILETIGFDILHLPGFVGSGGAGGTP